MFLAISNQPENNLSCSYRHLFFYPFLTYHFTELLQNQYNCFLHFVSFEIHTILFCFNQTVKEAHFQENTSICGCTAQ